VLKVPLRRRDHQCNVTSSTHRPPFCLKVLDLVEIIIFSGLVAELKDSFHMLIYRLTNEAFFDIGICENCKLRGGD